MRQFIPFATNIACVCQRLKAVNPTSPCSYSWLRKTELILMPMLRKLRWLRLLYNFIEMLDLKNL